MPRITKEEKNLLKQLEGQPELFLTKQKAIALCQRLGVLTPFERVQIKLSKKGICGEGFN